MAAKDMDYEFVEDPAEELTCSICMKVLCEPHMVNCCGKQFCEHCLEKWLLKNKTCPHCRQESFHHMHMQPTSRKTGELKVYCPNRQHGCKVVLKISEYEQHLSTTDDRGCLYIKLKCRNDCTAEVFRGEMQGHIQKECPRRLVSCFHCNLQGEHQHITGDHEEECPSYPLLCPRGCKDTVLRKDLETHQNSCLLEPVLCPLHQLGCKVEVCRKNLAKHVDSSALQHMTVLAKSHVAMSEQHAVLEAEHDELKADHATLKEDHTTLKEEHATLKNEHMKLAMKHSALEKNYTAEQESYYAKVRSIAPVIQNLPFSPDNHYLAQISTILADPSYVKKCDSVDLILSDINEMFGSHHFIYKLKPLSELKFRLEWEKENVVHTSAFRYKFKLYSITDLSAENCRLNTSVKVTLSSINKEPGASKESVSKEEKKVASICCARPEDIPGDAKLIGTVTLDCQKRSSMLVTIGVKFTWEEPSWQCGCECHENDSTEAVFGGY